MNTVTFYLGLIPTGYTQEKQEYCISELHRNMHVRLRDTSFLLQAMTGHDLCDKIAKVGLKGIFQEPMTFDGSHLATAENMEECLQGVLPGFTNKSLLEHCPEACGALKQEVERKLMGLAMEIRSDKRWKKITPLRVFGCSNMVVPLTLVHRMPIHLPPRPGTILAFELLFEGEGPPTLVSTLAIEP